MKKAALSLLICCIALIASAQYNYYKLSFGLGAGLTRAYADLDEMPYKRSIAATLDYNLTPFISAGIEIQNGKISGGDSLTNKYLRFFKNNYTAVIANSRLQLGQFIDPGGNEVLDAIKGLYAGTGIGVIMNNNKEIKRFGTNSDGTAFIFPGKSKSSNLMFPVMIGFNCNLPVRSGYTRFTANLNYQFNFTFGEGLDGYNDPPIELHNKYPDMYSVISVGVKYSFGAEGLY